MVLNVIYWFIYDVISLVVQGVGGGLAATAPDAHHEFSGRERAQTMMNAGNRISDRTFDTGPLIPFGI